MLVGKADAVDRTVADDMEEAMIRVGKRKCLRHSLRTNNGGMLLPPIPSAQIHLRCSTPTRTKKKPNKIIYLLLLLLLS